MKRSVSVAILFITTAFIVSSSAKALTFAKCQKVLEKSSDNKPFVLESEEFFTSSELDKFQVLFDRYQNNQTPRSDVGGVLRFLNPFKVEALYNPHTMRFSGIPSGLNRDEAFVYGMLKKMFNASLKQTVSHPLLNSHLDPSRNWKIRMFAIRYLLAPGQISPGLAVHRDYAEIQSLVVLRRPRFLIGGETKIVWPERQGELGPGYVEDKVKGESWTPQSGINHLLVYDDRFAYHGTSDFNMTRYQSTDVKIRDVIGLFIKMVQ